jgi:phosphoribosylanthranilate isomerase
VIFDPTPVRTRARFKVCYIGSVAEARLAIDHGSDAIGLVSAMPSGPGVMPDHLSAEIAASITPDVSSFLLSSSTDADRRQARPGEIEEIRGRAQRVPTVRHGWNTL